MKFVISDAYGIHTRVAMEIVKLVDRYSVTLNFVVNGKRASGSSILGLMQLGARKGDVVTLEYLRPIVNQVEFETLLKKIIEG